MGMHAQCNKSAHLCLLIFSCWRGPPPPIGPCHNTSLPSIIGAVVQRVARTHSNACQHCVYVQYALRRQSTTMSLVQRLEARNVGRHEG
eukprot:1137066-Pelagomonas_calceolata.AAC.7